MVSTQCEQLADVSLLKFVKGFFLLLLVYLVFVIFVTLDCHWPDLDGFDQHFQATVHFPLTSTVN